MKIKELNIDYTVASGNTKVTSDFSKRLDSKYPTPIADKLLEDNKDINKYDEHKLYK